MDKDLKIKRLEDQIDHLKRLLESCESVKSGEVGMNQSLKIQIAKQREYIKELVRLNEKYISEIAKARGDLEFFLERR